MKFASADASVWTVGDLVQAFADALQSRFNTVTVRGELSAVVRAASGHTYFNLKDENGTAQLRCVLFRQRAAAAGLVLRDGLRVRLRATVTIYEPRGDLQLLVDSVQHDGAGALLEAFMRLKAKLQAEGVFDAARKRPLPVLPRAVGIITSLQAAALRDVLTALRRRSPHVPVVVYPASVQGPQAPAELTAALRTAQSRQEVDLLLLVRGGGSLDDLWAFNDETLVRAIAACTLPVVSGVGHETDFTLADFAADLRAPTPTAAAELGVAAQAQLGAQLDQLTRRLRHAMQRQLQREQQRCDRLALRWPQAAALLAAPQRRLTELGWTLQRALTTLPARQGTRLEALEQRLRHATQQRLSAQAQALTLLRQRLPDVVHRQLERLQLRLDRAAAHLQLLSPRATLARGYLLGLDASGRALHLAALHSGQVVQLADASQARQLQIAQISTLRHPLDEPQSPCAARPRHHGDI
ncbi:exodeoxyribonuclease VII large subunit [Thiomonas sp.]|uniref:exodeoxyribonuclease VII large subunit n=1 Tax=Thiomonas sp. TaxID=2047785 RepID=UPI002618C3CD|nr:exodeoxyribonuclease VII large subunit [Thiomonas sp.]